jgi:arylsulfatase A-like enzyme
VVDWYHDDKPLNEDGYSTHLITQEACRLISIQPRTKPLFLYVPFNGVHAPHQVPASYLKPYEHLSGSRKQLAGMLAAVDEGIGQIVDALERAGLRDHTLIIFSTDNGGAPPGKNTPLSGFKGSIAEGGVRGCAFATWPGRIPAGRRLAQPMHIIDWYPTLVTRGGGSLEQKLPIDGKDVWPMLTTDAPSPHDAILCAQTPTRAAVRMGDWKLVMSDGDMNEDDADRQDGKKAKARKGNPQVKLGTDLALYHLGTDPGETKNLATQEPQRVREMQARLNDFLKDAVPLGESAP